MSNSWTSPGGDSPDDENRPDRDPQQPQQPQRPDQPRYGQYAPHQPQYGQNGQQQPQYGQYGGQQPPEQPQYGGQQPPQQPQYGQYGQYGGQQQPPQPQQPSYGTGSYPGQFGGGPGYTAPPVKPGVIPLRPLRLGDIFEGAIATIRGNPGATLGLAAIFALIAAIPSVVIALLLNNTDAFTITDESQTTDLSSNLASVASSVISSITGVLLSGMLIVVLSEAVLGRRISISETWARAKGRLLPLLGMTFLAALVVVVGIAVITGLALLLGFAVAPWLGILFGVLAGLAAFVAIVWAGVKISLAAAALVLERIGPIQAWKRSWALTRDQWWRIFGITLLAQLAVSFIAGIASIPVTAIAAGSIMAGDSASTGAVVATELVSALITVFTAPFLAGVTGLLYLDQRMRKEALDVTLMQTAEHDHAGKV